MPKRKIVRSDHGGERIRFWVDSDEQAFLRQAAAKHGVTVSAAAKRALSAHLRACMLAQEPDRPLD